MPRLVLLSSVLVISIAILLYNNQSLVKSFLETISSHTSLDSTLRPRPADPLTISTQSPEPTKSSKELMNAIKNTMSKTLSHAKITPHRSGARGHSDHGWLNTYHSFSFADWYNPNFTHFGSLRVLNEDRVKPNTGFPTHPHRDFEIFSYILSGELTHRDSMLKKGNEGGQSDKFYRMHRGDVQFTTGGTGIAHSEFNEHNKDTVHFLQIWAMPWKRGLTPRYHTRHFADEDKKKGFVAILSPLKGGADATAEVSLLPRASLNGQLVLRLLRTTRARCTFTYQ
jgi:quercetin 2,3-dioxygenase